MGGLYFLSMKYFFSGLRGGLSAALLVLLWLAGPAARAQAPAWQTAVAVSQATTAFSYVNQTTVDASGNVFVAGSFAGAVTFGSTTLTTAPASTSRDMFVAKWSPATGQFVWAQQQSNGAMLAPVALAVQGSAVYVSASGTTTSVGRVYKFTDAGSTASLTWTQAFTYADMGGLAVSGSSVYVTGSFTGATLALGAFTLSNASPNDADLFVAKLTDAGSTSSFAWAIRAGGVQAELGGPVVAVGSTLYLTGYFYGTTSTPTILGTTQLTTAGSSDVFVAKLADTGPNSTFSWARRLGGTDYELVNALAVSGSAVYVGGKFGSPTADFGLTILANAGPATGPVTTDGFVTKLTDTGSAGTFAWAQRTGGPGNDEVTALAVQGAGLYLAGNFESSNASVGATTLASAGSADGFVAALIDAGPTSRFAWAQAVGGSNYDFIGGLSLAGSTAYVGGGIGSVAASFPPRVVSNPSGTPLAVLASFAATTLTATTAAPGSLSFALAPNPAHAAATLTLPAVPGTATATLTLRDALGRTLRTATLPLPAAGLRHELDLGGLAPGIYAVQVRAGATSATRRLVVE
jgi:hypothetical protein